MKIIIDYIGDPENTGCPYFWMISKNGCNDGHGWSATEKQAVEDATAYYMSTYKGD